VHCIVEKKLRRKYVTRMGISAIEKFIRDEPDKAIKVFGSKAAISHFEQSQKKSSVSAEPSVDELDMDQVSSDGNTKLAS